MHKNGWVRNMNRRRCVPPAYIQKDEEIKHEWILSTWINLCTGNFPIMPCRLCLGMPWSCCIFDIPFLLNESLRSAVMQGNIHKAESLSNQEPFINKVSKFNIGGWNDVYFVNRKGKTTKYYASVFTLARCLGITTKQRLSFNLKMIKSRFNSFLTIWRLKNAMRVYKFQGKV